MVKKVKNILFTGGTGLLSSFWAASISGNKYKITLGLNRRLLRSKFITYEQINFENLFELEKKIKKNNFDIIIHTASIADVDKCEKYPVEANKVNYIYTKNLVNICKKLNIKLIYISTDHLFDGKSLLYKEDDVCKPLNVYSSTKLKSENYIKNKLKNYLILRTNFFGKGPYYRPSFSDTIINFLKNEKKFYVSSKIFFSPISISLLVKYSMMLINKNALGIFNISSTQRISKYNFSKLIAKEYNLNLKNIIDSSKFLITSIAKRPPNMSLSNLKLRKYLKLNIPSLEEQIKKLKKYDNIYKNFFKEVKAYGNHYIDKQDIKEVVKVLKSPYLTQGPKIDEFENALAKYVGSKYAIALSSATAGLHICGLVAGITKNTYAITSPITFVSTANAITYNNGKVLFSDISSKDLNIDPKKIKKLIERKKTIKAIFPVHFGGYPCKMEEIYKISKKKNILVIEDAAHALGGKYITGEKIGSCKYSDMCVFSLHPVKSIAAGEGGVITTNNYDHYRKLLRLRSHGINKLDDNFLNNEFSKTDGYSNPWYHEMQEIGFHYRITDIQASLALSQLKKLDKFISKRRKLSNIYDKAFKNSKYLSPILKDKKNLSSRHIYIVKVNLKKLKMSRSELMVKLYNQGIGTQIHYLPVTEHPFYKKRYGNQNNKKYLKNAYDYYDSCLTLPLYYTLNYSEQKRIISVLNNI